MKVAGIVLLVFGVVIAAALSFADLDVPFVGNLGLTVGLSVGFPLILIGALLVWYGASNANRQAQTQHLLQVGQRATVRVMHVGDTGVSINDNPHVQLVVDVYPEGGGAPFRVAKSVTVSRLAIPRVGDTYPGLFDPSNPNALVFGAQLPQAYGAAAPAAPPPSAWS